MKPVNYSYALVADNPSVFPDECMKISDYLNPGDIIPMLASTSKNEVLGELAAGLAGRHDGIDGNQLLNVLKERENLGSTGIGGGVAIPHAKLDSARSIMAVLGRSSEGIPFDAIDGKPVHLFFLLVARGETFEIHLKLLARISRILKNPSFRKCLLDARDTETIYEVICEQDERF